MRRAIRGGYDQIARICGQAGRLSPISGIAPLEKPGEHGSEKRCERIDAQSGRYALGHGAQSLGNEDIDRSERRQRVGNEPARSMQSTDSGKTGMNGA
jgi:hypothetical protein